MKNSVRLLILLSGVLAAGCNPTVRFAVSVFTDADCVIRSNGEFCDEEEFLPPPKLQAWNMEVRKDLTYIYTHDDLWISDDTTGGPFSLERVTNETKDLCSTTTTHSFDLQMNVEDTGLMDEQGQAIPPENIIVGLMDERIRTEGPESCGETPFGTHITRSFVGVRQGL